MDKKQFINLVGSPSKFNPQDRAWLHAVQAKYPHSSVIGLLTYLADHTFQYDTPEQRRAVMLSLCNDKILDQLLARVSNTTADDPSFDVLSEVNTFQEVSFKTAPKSVILSNFLQAGPSEDVKKVQSTPAPAEIDDKKSLKPNEVLGTETLAVILEQQGHADKALAIYRNLLAHNPEKSSIFAPRIERLENIINSK